MKSSKKKFPESKNQIYFHLKGIKRLNLKKALKRNNET